MALTRRFDEAFFYANLLHRTHTPKRTPVPYISHLMAVTALVIEHGGDEDQAIAALLHDGPEDQGGKAKIRELAAPAFAAQGGVEAWIVDDTGFQKKGSHSGTRKFRRA
jgi:hypothetical protein